MDRAVMCGTNKGEIMEIKLNMSDTACSWCDSNKHATYEITVDGWADYACREHAVQFFPESDLAPAREVAYVRTHLMTDSREIVAAMAAHVGKEMTVHVYDRGAVKKCHVLLAAVGGDRVAFWCKGSRFNMDAFDVFANRCTHVYN